MFIDSIVTQWQYCHSTPQPSWKALLILVAFGNKGCHIKAVTFSSLQYFLVWFFLQQQKKCAENRKIHLKNLTCTTFLMQFSKLRTTSRIPSPLDIGQTTRSFCCFSWIKFGKGQVFFTTFEPLFQKFSWKCSGRYSFQFYEYLGSAFVSM
jgi:hypothetical protein